MTISNEDFEQYLFRKYKDTIDFELAKDICSRDYFQYLVNTFINVHQSVPNFVNKINEDHTNNRVIKTISKKR